MNNFNVHPLTHYALFRGSQVMYSRQNEIMEITITTNATFDSIAVFVICCVRSADGYWILA